MAITERHGMSGILTITARDRLGNIVERRRVNNAITLAGKALMAEIFTGGLPSVPRLFVAAGTDGTEVRETDTELGGLALEAIAETENRENVVRVNVTLPSDDTAMEIALREAGIRIHLHNREPVLYNRVVFPVITKTGSLDMTMSWEVTF